MWFLPSYRRPELAKRFFEAATATGIATTGVLFVQGDRSGYDFPLPPGWTRAVARENIGLVAALNRCFSQYREEPWYGLLADDLLPLTEQWDTRLLESLFSMGIVSCNDRNRPYEGGRMCGATIIHGDLVRAAGFLAPPACWHSYTDDWWELVGTTFNPCWIRVGEVHVAHDTPVFGNRAQDETHVAAYGDHYARLKLDGEAYKTWLQDSGLKALGKIAIARAQKRT